MRFSNAPFRALALAAAALCSFIPLHAQDYTLTVEAHAEDGIPGLTTYRMYIDMVNETDFMSSVFGNDQHPLHLGTTTSFYNDQFGSTTADGINPAFFPFVPTSEFDSWVTIGIAGSPTPPETAITTVESPENPWVGCFSWVSALNGTDVVIDDVVGGGWFVLNGTPNGLPNPNTMRTLIGQFTTDGVLSGTINAQIFPLGVGANDVIKVYTFEGPGTFTAQSADDVVGCLVAGACNYNPDATVEGPCDYLSCVGCTDESACNYDAEALYNDGSCEFLSCQTAGCTNPAACNYNPDATFNDNSCEFSSCVGCTDPNADNFNPDATVDNGQCSYLGCTQPSACNFDPQATDTDGSCEFTSCAGCTVNTACNYDPEATIAQNATCTFPEPYRDCAGACLLDSDSDGVCDAEEIAGCTDPAAPEYSPSATDDDGSCFAVSGCTVPAACNYNANADTDDGSCEYSSCAGCTDTAACNFDATATLTLNTECTYPTAPFDCGGNCVNDADSDGVCDELEVPGCTDASACNYSDSATDDDGSCTYVAPFSDCAGNCLNDADGDGVCDELEHVGCTDALACNYDASASEDDGSCDFCSCQADLFTTNYTLTVEAHAVGGIAGMTTYRAYVNMLEPTDFLSSVFGNNDMPLAIDVEGGFYNDAFASGSTADGVNAGLLGFFPTLNYDSWVTIGISASPTPPQTAISIVESEDQPWVGAFNANSTLSGSSIAMNDVTGGAWYVLNGTPNGLPDALNQRTLLFQITSEHAPTGTINVQIFPNGVGSNQQQLTFEFNGEGTFLPTSVPVNACGCTDATASNYDAAADYEDGTCEYIVFGCLDEEACNFNALATDDDGSCSYPDAGYDCAGNCLNDADADGVCDEFEVPGCTDASACNFSAAATDEDGSCLAFDACGVCGGSSEPGCMDPSACNFNPNAGCADLSLCDWTACAGCTDEGACNFDPEAAVADLGACTYPENLFTDCAGACLDGFDADGNGVCDPLDYAGCTDTAAINFNAVATADDGSCFYVVVGCVIEGAVNFDPEATVQGVPILAFCTFSAGSPAPLGSATDCTIAGACNFGAAGPCDFESCLGCTLESACNYDVSAVYNDGSCEFTSCVGCLNDLACNYDAEASIAGACDYSSCLGCTDESADNFDAEATTDNGSCFTTGCMLANACNFNPIANNPANDTCELPETGYGCDGACIDANANGICDFEDDCVAGCTVPSACNFNPLATVDSGHCQFFDSCGVCGGNGIPEGACDCDGNFPEPGYSCEGECLIDGDGDGVCDLDEITGCQDASACNFDAAATDAGYCAYAAEGYGCDGECLSDADADGVCDAFEVAGCTSGTACNFDAAATDDDGSCVFAEAGYDCAGTCLFDADADGVCDQWEVTGCQDASACNFDAAATDAGYCAYAAEGYGCDGECLGDADGDGVCDAFEVAGCTSGTACNFDAAATDDDGSCVFAEAGYDCAGTCLFDADADGVCDQWEVTGCQDASACNFDAAATDAGYCDYAAEGYGCDGECLSDADADGVCDAFEQPGCTDPDALNFVAYATEDAPCVYAEDFINDCPIDLSGDGNINTADLLLLLAGMGDTCEEFYGFPE